MSSDFLNLALDLLQGLGDVRARRMFGGHGVFRGDLMFGLVVDDMLYLKADGGNRPRFEALGLPAFTYSRQGKTRRIAYYLVPESALEDPQLMLEWAGGALAAAERAAAKTRRAARP